MSKYFAFDYTGAPFVLFGTWHLVALLVIVLLNASLLGFRKTSEKTRTTVRWTMAIVLWADETSWHIWNLYWGHWTVKTMLPLHICSIMIWLAGFMLIFKIHRIYEFVYFIGIQFYGSDILFSIFTEVIKPLKFSSHIAEICSRHSY